jgi:hypothetical protein
MKEPYTALPGIKGTTMGRSPMFQAFIALNNEEAHYVCDLLVDAGINAQVNDVEPAVWIDTLHIDRAKRVLDAYLLEGIPWRTATWLEPAVNHQQIEQQAAEWYEARRRSGGAHSRLPETIEVTCEECGKRTPFPAVLRGNAGECSHCGATVDIGEAADFEMP